MTRVAAALVFGFGLALGLTGCVSVAPYARERLAHPAMNDGADSEGDAMTAHVRGAREAALPAGEHAGGGCGCD